VTEPATQLQSSPETPLPRTSTMAIVSLITGILAYVMLPFVGAIAAVITGHLAKKEIRESGGLASDAGGYWRAEWQRPRPQPQAAPAGTNLLDLRRSR